MGKEGERRRQLVLVPFPFQGHINPMLQLGAILHSRGFSITIAETGFSFQNQSDYPDFTFLTISDSLPHADVSSQNLVEFISGLNANCEAPFQDMLTGMMVQEQGSDHNYDDNNELPCIIYDELMYFSESIASKLKLPSIILTTGSAANLLTYHVCPSLQKEGLLPLRDSLSTDIVPGLSPLRFNDLPIYNFENVDSLLQLMASASSTRSSLAIICNTMNCIEQSSVAQLQHQFLQVPVFAIGPIHKLALASSSRSLTEEQKDCIAWLDNQTPNTVIYDSLGSIVCMDEKEVAEMAWGLANSMQPFLWVIRTSNSSSDHGSKFLPDGFAETVGDRGLIVHWAPQKEVLAHAALRGFWSHCGWNSVLESISEGVPMICRPSFGDQRGNARYVTHEWRVGLELEKDQLERGEVERAIRRLMVDEEGEAMRQRAMELKQKAELDIKSGGSSYNSLDKLVELIMSG